MNVVGLSVVLIPFIAGQWSLPADDADEAAIPLLVLIPFIAGQWSLPATVRCASATSSVFQSPSLRGSGRFALAVWRAHAEAAGFNPLHCGAVVASDPRRMAFRGGQNG